MSRRSIGFLTVLVAVCLVAGPALAQAQMGLKVTDITGLIREFKTVDADGNGKLSHSELGQRFHWPVPPGVLHNAPAHGAAAGLGFTHTGLFTLLANFRVIDSNADGLLEHGELMSFLKPESQLETGDTCGACPRSQEMTCSKAPSCKGAVRCESDPSIVCHKAPKCEGAIHCGKGCEVAGEKPACAESCGKVAEKPACAGKCGKSCGKAPCAGRARRHHRHDNAFRWHRHPGSGCKSVAEQTVVK